MLMTIDISVAEVLDRISICKVKLKHISDAGKRRNIETELAFLNRRLEDAHLSQQILDFLPALVASNEENFMQIDKVFACDAKGDFGPDYATAAHDAFCANAERARIKRRINELTQSEIIEEKTY